MSKSKSRRGSPLSIALRKLFVSGFVVFSFVAYAVHERLVSPGTIDNLPTSNNSSSQAQLHLTSQQQVASNSVQQQSASSPDQQVASNPAQQQSAANDANQQQPNLVERNPAVIPTNQPPPTNPPPPTATPSGMYRDGEYTGPVIDAYYGLVQVKAVVQGGKITSVQFLQYPNDRRTSQRINSIAMPYLQQEAVQSQSAYVNLISGATLTSEGFVQSLQYALKKAKNS